jgi:D-alanyl-D-alanine carboxypeptidase
MFQRLAALSSSEIHPRLTLIGQSLRTFATLICGGTMSVLLATAPAKATPSLVIDQDTGAVLSMQDATEPWYPASLTKLMTAYVVLDEIRAGRLSPDSLVVLSANAARQAPSKMGFRPGTVLTVDNALKMLLVKSANDIAVTLAEGIGGSVEGFAEMMNRSAQRLGMADSHFENPNGLPNLAHHSSAQDLAILARALLTEFPDYRDYFGIGAIALGGHVFHTYNGLLGRYPGVDGMKTGFICAGGFNTVVSAQRGGRRLIAVVLGQPSASVRSVVTANLLDKAFAASSWGSLSTLTGLARVGGAPPDMHAEICGRHGRRRAVTWEQAADAVATPCSAQPGANNVALETLLNHSGGCGTEGKTASPNTPIAFDPVTVFVGPSPGSATAIQPPATLATLASSPAASAKAASTPGSVPGAAAAFAPAGGSEADALPGQLKHDVAPVRLHNQITARTVDKAAAKSEPTARGKRGAKLAAKTPAQAEPAAARPEGKHVVQGKRKRKGHVAASARLHGAALSAKSKAKATTMPSGAIN